MKPASLPRARLLWALALTAAVSAAVWGLDRAAMAAIRRPELVNGWVLAGLVAALLLLHLRKAVPVLPLVDASVWARVHVALGVMAGAVFVLHTGPRWPSGPFDIVLWLLFVVVALSGLVGWLLQRILPPRLRGRGGVMIAERIPARRAELAREAAAVVDAALRETGSRTLPDLYLRDLEPFLRGPRDRLAHLRESHGPAQRLDRLLDQNARFLDARGRAALERLRALVAEKIVLDHQAALLSALKLWTLVHVPLTYVLLIAIVVHIVAVHAFSAGGL